MSQGCQSREIVQTRYCYNRNIWKAYWSPFGMANCKPVSTPLEVGKTFHKRTDVEEPCDVQVYQHAIGFLTCVSTATRPDTSAAVGTLSQYMSNPSKDHWMGVKRLLIDT